MRDTTIGRARGFAFIETSTDEEAGKAIAQFNDYAMGGLNLTVQRGSPEAGTVRCVQWWRRPAPVGTPPVAKRRVPPDTGVRRRALAGGHQ